MTPRTARQRPETRPLLFDAPPLRPTPMLPLAVMLGGVAAVWVVIAAVVVWCGWL